MATLHDVSRLDHGDIGHAAALLSMAHRAYPARRLLGSVTLAGGVPDVCQYMGVVLFSQRFGSVDLVHCGEELVGVACWIQHPVLRDSDACTPGSPSASASASASASTLASNAPGRIGGLDRLDMVDLPFKIFDVAFGVPDDTHLHLACLGTQNGRDTRMIADLLLRDQHQRVDRYGRALPLHIEAHDPADRAWLHRLGYRHRGSYLSLPTEPRSYAMSRTPESDVGASGCP